MRTIGIDEVGRGCWAGPLVAGAVLLDDSVVLPADRLWKLADSKRLSKTQRQASSAGIRQSAVAYGLGWVSAAEVDELGLTAAVGLAMRRALAELRKSTDDADEIIIDGSYNFLPEEPLARAAVKADGSVPTVSAASILAKVARDDYMASEAEGHFPGYGFARHVGYGTRQHAEALQRLGVCELHRRSFKPVRALC